MGMGDRGTALPQHQRRPLHTGMVCLRSERWCALNENSQTYNDGGVALISDLRRRQWSYEQMALPLPPSNVYLKRYRVCAANNRVEISGGQTQEDVTRLLKLRTRGYSICWHRDVGVAGMTWASRGIVSIVSRWRHHARTPLPPTIISTE